MKIVLAGAFGNLGFEILKVLTDKGCVKWAEENGVKVIDVKEMEIINDKRSKEKGK